MSETTNDKESLCRSKVFEITLKDVETGKEKVIVHIARTDASDNERCGSLKDMVSFEWLHGMRSCDCTRFYDFYGKNEAVTFRCGSTRFKLIKIEESLQKLEEVKESINDLEQPEISSIISTI